MLRHFHRPTFGRVNASIALAALACATATAASARTTMPAVRAIHRVAPAFTTASYSLKDVGAPPTSTWSSFTYPTGFNATGQLVGGAQLVKGSPYQQCLAYTGKGWVNVLGAPTLTCYPTSGISDANSSGVFKTVGGTYVPTVSQEVAYYATVLASSSTAIVSSSNSNSNLYAMNAAGTAVGAAYYNPIAGFSYSQPPVISTGGAISELQPQCAKLVAGCTSQPSYVVSQTSLLRAINKGGTVLAPALNSTNGTYVEYTPGSKPTFVQFTPPLDNGYGPSGLYGMDDQGNVVYDQYHKATTTYLARVYAPKSKTLTTIPALSGSSCTQYVPLYINGPGRVLGQTQGCSFAADYVYWTWDKTNGIVAVGFNHSKYNAANLYVINDLGQISVDLSTSSNVHHWGYLTPPTKL